MALACAIRSICQAVDMPAQAVITLGHGMKIQAYYSPLRLWIRSPRKLIVIRCWMELRLVEEIPFLIQPN